MNNVKTEIDRSEDTVMSKDNDDNTAMSNKESPHAIPGNEYVENSEPGENSTEEVPSPLIYGRKKNNPTKVKTSKRHRPIRITPLESPMGNPHVVKQKAMHSILQMCEYMNSSLKAHQTPKI